MNSVLSTYLFAAMEKHVVLIAAEATPYSVRRARPKMSDSVSLSISLIKPNGIMDAPIAVRPNLRSQSSTNQQR